MSVAMPQNAAAAEMRIVIHATVAGCDDGAMTRGVNDALTDAPRCGAVRGCHRTATPFSHKLGMIANETAIRDC
jgi:hypothetical protein